jgi:hypothetical protein
VVELCVESDAHDPAEESALGVVDVVPVVVPGSPLGDPVVVVVVVVGSAVGGADVVSVPDEPDVVPAALESLHVVAGVVAVGVVVVAGVVDARTVASVCVWVRPGGGALTLGLVSALVVAVSVCLAAGFSTGLCAAAAALAGAGFCGCVTAVCRWTTTWIGGGVAAAVVTGAGAGAAATEFAAG